MVSCYTARAVFCIMDCIHGMDSYCSFCSCSHTDCLLIVAIAFQTFIYYDHGFGIKLFKYQQFVTWLYIKICW